MLFSKNDEEIAALFMKINFSSDGKITWEEFCTFMQLNFSEKEETVKRQKEVVFITPAKTENNPHRSPTQKITCTGDNSFMVMSSVSFSSKIFKIYINNCIQIFQIFRKVSSLFGILLVN